MGIQFDGINNEIKSQTKIDFPGSVGVAGTLTYEDVANVDSIGIITARTGINIGPTAGVAGTFFTDGSYVTAGVVTATTFYGSGANLTSLPSQVTINNASGNRVITSDGGTTLNGEANFSYDGTKCLIGTSTGAPYANRNLTVAQGSSGNTTVAIEVRSPTDGDGRIVFTDSTSDEAGAYKGQIRYDQTNDFMSFNTNGDNERLRINSSGQMGLGGTPTHRLELFNAADTENILMIRGADATTEYAAMGVSGGNAVITGGGVGSTNAGISFRTAASGTEHERLRIFSNGDIGINATTVNRSSTNRNTIQFDYSGSDGSEGLEIRLSNSALNGNAATDNAAITYIGQNLGITNRENGLITLNNNGAERLRILSGGDIIFGSSGAANNSNTVSIHPTDGMINFGMDGRTGYVTGTNSCYIYSGEGASGTTLAGELYLQSRSNVDRDIVFVTGSTPAERLRVHSSGALGIAGKNYGSSGQVLTSQGSGSAVQWATPSSGVNMVDEWRLSTNLTNGGSESYITSNWVRNEDTNWGGGWPFGGSIGSAMTQSSGYFNFPSTGIYKVEFNMNYSINDANTKFIECNIIATRNNSNYTIFARSYGPPIHSDAHNEPMYGSAYTAGIMDVTNTTNCRFRLNYSCQTSSNTIIGGSHNATHVTVTRLGNT